MRLITAALVGLLLLTGCGLHHSASEAKGPASSGYGSARDIADALQCSGSYTSNGAQAEMFTSDSGACDYSSDNVTLDWFNSSTSLANFRQVASGFGGSAVYGKNWVVECQVRSACQAVAQAIGGTLV